MTMEEAKHIVDVAFSVPQAVRRAGEDRTYHEDEIREAKNMAIKALEQEPCEDAISRADTIEWLKKVTATDGITFETGFKQILTDIQNMPSVTPKQKMGRWIWQTEDIYRCSECGEDIHVKEVMNVPQYEFCPICGAKMAESEDNG